MQDKKNILILLLTFAVAWLGMDLWLKPHHSKYAAAPSGLSVPVGSSAPSSLVSQESLSLGQKGPMIAFENDTLSGFLDLKGGVLRQCALKDYRETTDPQSPAVEILSQDQKLYGAHFGWVAPVGSAMDFPDANTLWSCDQFQLTPVQPIQLYWTNAKGVKFFLEVSLEDQYLLRITQRVENHGTSAMECVPSATLVRQGPVKTSGYMMLYEGPLGMAEGKLQESTYDNLTKAGTTPWMNLDNQPEKRGWLGMTDKYWLTALIPSQGSKGCFTAEGKDFYRVKIQSPGKILQVGEAHSDTTHVFFGPKKLSLLEDCEKKLSMDHFDRAVDFGWFYFITKPMFNLLSGLQKILGNFGLAILTMTIAIKILFFPLSSRSFRAMARMRALQPQIQGMKTRFGEDKMRLNQAMIDLYKREKINPVSGCLPMLVQIPIFFSLYKVLFISIEMRHAPFWGWIKDLSAPDPTSIFSGFGLLPWTVPLWLQIGLWPILMGITMVAQQMMNSSNVTDAQQKIMLTYIMPVMFTFMLAQFPVGLVIYWTWSNFLTIAQQWFMMRHHSSV